jgi:serine/threonine-protein kinase
VYVFEWGLEQPMALTAGTRLGIYEITGQLGAGGMGEVYRAKDTKLGRDVAIKTLPSALAKEADRLARFEREAKLLAALNHAHIGAIYGLDEHEGTLYIAMELVEGETLEAKLKAGALPTEDALQLALQIAGALEAAHEKGVVHRDLKPANIMVLPNAQVKVLDFGLAKAFSGNPNEASPAHSPALSVAMTQQGLILGTAGYMSPEQASGQATDQRADVWAFGVVLYEMLTGLPLFRGESVPHILADVLRAPPDWTRLPKNLHPRVRQALERCLEKKPRNRYSGVADARVDIEAALADPTGGAVPAVASGNPAAARGRLALVGVAAAALAAAAVWALMPRPEPHPVVRFPFFLPEGENFTRPEVSMIALSADGTRLAYVANSQIYVRNLSETEPRVVSGITGGPLGVSSPAFSPDGQWLAYVEVVTALQGLIKRVPVSGGTPATLYEVIDSGFPMSLTWPTPDAILFANLRGILRIPATGGAPEVLVAREVGESFASPILLPGGDAVLFARAEGNPGAGTFGADTQIVTQTIGAADRAVVWDGGGAPTYLPSGHLIYAQGNTLFGIAFDAGRRAVAGGPVPLVEGVRRTSNAFTDAAQYAVSATGTLVTIPGTAADQPDTVLTLVDRSGNVSPLDVPRAQYRSPRVSPDGQRVAVEVVASGQGHIWIYDLAGDSAIRRLTQTGNNTRPIWTPDSSSVTFGSERDGSWGIYEQPADGSRLAERLTTADEGRRHFPDSWSPDGQTLAYTDAGLENAEWDAWLFSRASGDTELLAGGDVNQFLASFSPDGRWIAYTNQAPPFGIQVQPFPPTGVIHQITETNEAAPLWTAAGNELFFRLAANTSSDTPSQIMGLEIATAGGITFKNPRSLPIQGALMSLGYRDFDVTPDGERFVMIYPADTATRQGAAPAPRIDVVLNWQQEVVSRVPVP